MEEINSQPPATNSTNHQGLTLSILFLLLGLVVGYTSAIYLPRPSILAQKSCTPRPACLDTEPRCLLPETPDMCPPAPTPTTNPIPDKNQAINTPKFKITIPPNWKPMDGGGYQAPDGSTFVLTVFVNQDSLSDYLAKKDKTDQTAWEGQPSKKIISSKKTTVAGLPAIQRIEEWLAPDYITINTYTLVDRVIYSFYISPFEIPYDQTEVYEKYQSILDSFEPISSTSEFTCPQNGWQDCMPILNEEGKLACSSEAMAWYKANCPGFQGAAL